MLPFAYAKNMIKDPTNPVHEEIKEQDIHSSANRDHLNTAPPRQDNSSINSNTSSSKKAAVNDPISNAITPPVTPKKPSATSIFDNPHLNILYNNRTAILAVIGSITLILFPQIVMSLVALHPITCIVTALYLMAIYAISRGSSSDESAYGLFQYMHDLTYYGNSYPQLIAITATICLLSTQAPLNIYFSYRMMQALMGNSLSEFKIANQCYLAYITVRHLLQRVYCKIRSQVIGARQGGDMQKLRQEQLGQHNESNDFSGQNTPFQDASKLSMATWYFIQTCMQAGITMVSSLNAMVNFSLPATLNVARRLLMIRTTATAISFTLLTFIASAWAAKAKGELNDLKYETDAGILNDSEFASKNNEKQESQAIASTIQDTFYDLAKNISSDNALTLLMIIVAINPAFPLGASITVAQVTALAGVLSRMTLDFLAIARNMNALSDAQAVFAKLAKTFGFSNGQLKTADKDITIDLELENGNARSYASGLMQTTFRDRLNANTVKARIQNVTDTLAFIALAIAALEMTTTPLIGLGLTPAFMSACAAAATYHVVSTVYNVLTSEDSANNSKRMSEFACNFATSALIVRLASMFVPQHILGTLSYLGVSAGLAPQLACLGIITSLVMTIFITPLSMQQKPGSTKDSAHEVFNDYTKLVVEPISAVYRKSNDLIRQVSKAHSKSDKDDNLLARTARMVLSPFGIA